MGLWPHGKEHIKQHCVTKMKKKNHTVETLSKSNIKIVEKGKTHKYMTTQ